MRRSSMSWSRLPPLDELHGDKGGVIFVAQLVNDHDVGVLESTGGARFLIEALQRIGLPAHARRDGLQGNKPANQRVAGLIDGAHRPAANLRDDSYLPNRSTDGAP